VRQFLWLALLSTPTRYGGPSLWRPFAMANPNPVMYGEVVVVTLLQDLALLLLFIYALSLVTELRRLRHTWQSSSVTVLARGKFRSPGVAARMWQRAVTDDIGTAEWRQVWWSAVMLAFIDDQTGRERHSDLDETSRELRRLHYGKSKTSTLPVCR